MTAIIAYLAQILAYAIYAAIAFAALGVGYAIYRLVKRLRK